MKKGFDAVAFQRKVREELGRRYWRDREAFLKELAEKDDTKNSSSRLPKVQTRKGNRSASRKSADISS